MDVIYKGIRQCQSMAVVQYMYCNVADEHFASVVIVQKGSHFRFCTI